MRVDVTVPDMFEPVGPSWSPRDRVFVRFYFRVTEGFGTNGASFVNVKWLRFHRDGNNLGVLKAEGPSWGFDAEAGAVQVDTGMFWKGTPSYASSYGITATCNNLDDGAWHSIELDYDREAASNVEVRFWCDGRPVILPPGDSSWGGSPWADIQYVGGDAASDTPTTLRASRMGSADVDAVWLLETISQGFDGSVWFDDVAISSQRIGP